MAQKLFTDVARSNVRRSWALLGVTGLLLWAVLSGMVYVFSQGDLVFSIVAGLAAGALYMTVALRSAAKATLRLTKALKAPDDAFPVLHNVVEEMAIAAGLPKPEVWVINDDAPNAFAAGFRPEDAVIAVTTGLMASMSRDELKGVVAHEMAHIRNRDIAVTTISVVTVSAFLLLSDILLRVALFSSVSSGRSRSSSRKGDDGGFRIVLILMALVIFLVALPLSILLKAAVSRARESLADASAVEFTRNPYGIRSALEKLEADTREIVHAGAGMEAMWIESPAHKARGIRASVSGLLDTHPPIADRIAALRVMEGLHPDERGPNDPYPQPAVL